MTGTGTTLDALGVRLPAPGWQVLDAVRERRFTGQATLIGVPPVRLWADQGRIYRAEPVGAPPMAARLVVAGGLSADDLARGLVRVAGRDHLGALFERAPLVDRHAILLAVASMTEEALRGIAAQELAAGDVAPYVFDPEGLHAWFEPLAVPAAREPHSSAQPSEPPSTLPAPTLPAPTLPPPPAGAPPTSAAPPVSGESDRSGEHDTAQSRPPPTSAEPTPTLPPQQPKAAPRRQTTPPPAPPQQPQASDDGFSIIWPDGDRRPAGSGGSGDTTADRTSALAGVSAATRGRLLDERFGSCS